MRPEVPRAPPDGKIHALEDCPRYLVSIAQDGSVFYLLYYEAPDIGTSGQGTHIASHVRAQVAMRVDKECRTEHRGGRRQYQNPARTPPPDRVPRATDSQCDKRR